MNNSSQRLFFGWDTPWLPRLASYLLNAWQQDSIDLRGDLSKTVVVVPGERAGRRLLELLALEAAKEKILFVPPRITTLQKAAQFLFAPSEKMLPAAGEWTCRLAWDEAFKRLPEPLLHALQPLSSQDQTTIFTQPGEQLVALVTALARELASAGLRFKNVAARLEAFFPESTEREQPRWEALVTLQQHYHAILKTWGTSDPMEWMQALLEKGNVDLSARVLVAGVVEHAPLFKTFFAKINPTIFIIAPEEQANGFTSTGELLPAYWLEHPAVLDDTQILPCERNDDQAAAMIRLLSPENWDVVTKNSTTAPASPQAARELISSLVTIAVPDATTLSLLQDRLACAGIGSHWAGGCFFRGGRLHQLLQTLADFFDQSQGGPSIAAVGALLRHPDIHRHCTDAEEFLMQLEAYEQEHLPPFVDKKSFISFQKKGDRLAWIEELEQLLMLDSMRSGEVYSLVECAQMLRVLLLRLLGKREVRREESEGHYFLGCLEQCLLALDEIESLSSSQVIFLFSDFIKKLSDLLAEKTIPEREDPDAIELLGWLEMAADDAPCALITSCYEGALPQSSPSNPLLPEGLRKNLGLPHESTLLARDHYFLQSIVASRQTILLTARYNGRGEPVRSSRLLLQGASLEKLPERVLALSQHVVTLPGALEKTREQTSSRSHFQARSLGQEKISTVTVTGLRTYLQSPRLFYLQHVLKLREMEEVPFEMQPHHFGTLLHAVLGAFGNEEAIVSQTDATTIANWLRKKLFQIAEHHFAPGPTFPITLQLEEAAQTLEGFAKAQAAQRRAGWQIIAAEQGQMGFSRPLEKNFSLSDGRSLLLQGRIDRIDWHSVQERWRIIDYKTLHRQDWKNATPNKEHFQKKGEEIFWKDLQLPLYLQLASQWEFIKESGLPLPTLENTDLCYFQLPIEPEKTALSEPFDSKMILPAWQETERVMKEILDGNFEALGEIDPAQMPTLAALCGISMLR